MIRLSDDVLSEPRFKEANPQHEPGKPCVYVGMTGLTPEERFERHKLGLQSCRFVKKYGERLMPGLYVCFEAMPFAEAARMERELARRLRANGFAVWQN